MLNALGVWLALTVGGLIIGMIGYATTEDMSVADATTEDMSVADAFVNAAMILSGMGPVSELHTADSKRE